ncbi:tyrosine-type recombinase/integrase [Aureispira anguillae]|uniref:Tyrosine-type recombinase/integrase n=1 Tax=Aureispira anguillae TaxID=2864201 RepID=A0A916DQ67_9BACT|nr:tyrosine-type recombinase/integrase [Aureispira anguillae]
MFHKYTNQYFNRTLKELAAIPKTITSHVGRHTSATHLVSKVPIHILKAILQHSKIETTMRYLMESILEKAYWDSSKRSESAYVRRIKELLPDRYLDYFLSRNEIFARLFEQYISYKLKELKIKNVFLTKTKYHTAQYMLLSEIKTVVLLFDKLLIQMRKHF